MLTTVYRSVAAESELCYYIETNSPLTTEEVTRLRWVIGETFAPKLLSETGSFLDFSDGVIELGPRMNFETSSSSNAVSICHAAGLTKVTRLEVSRRHRVKGDVDAFVAANHDRMTECVYPKPLTTFETGIEPKPVFEVLLIQNGLAELARLNKELGLGMDKWDVDYYHRLFTRDICRNPTSVECFQVGQANSEHCRHWFFKGKLFIDGQVVPYTLLELVQSTLKANSGNSVIAFKDNSSAIKGYDVWTVVPENPAMPSRFVSTRCTYHLLFTAETHNAPSGYAPEPGAETGAGGRIRDGHGTGRGSLVIAATAGYCVDQLHISGYAISGETVAEEWKHPFSMAKPIEVLLQASNGASDYGNKFGEPLIQGHARSFGLITPDGTRRSWIKPIMFSGGIGQIRDEHIEKAEPKKGMLIVRMGGRAYRIGVGGGSFSSMLQGEGDDQLNLMAVQRGNAQEANKLNRAIRAFVEMGPKNPLLVIHDQGAGGPCNVLTELVHPAGGRIKIRNISVGDKTLSVLEIWGAEFQESDGVLIDLSSLDIFKAVCDREGVIYDIVGEVTGDGKIVLHDDSNDTTPVDLDLDKILGDLPQKEFRFTRKPKQLSKLVVPQDRNLLYFLTGVFQQISVCSKEFLTRKVDRSVTGLIAQQQCCGPLQLPVSDVAVVAQSHFGLTGGAMAVGEQPLKMLIDEAAGARMAVGEMLTNIVWALLSKLEDIKCSGNWMWAAKLDDEGARLYDAAVACVNLMKELGIAIDGGKDSLTMAALVDGETVKAPGQLVISGYCTVPDITRVITPDIKMPGQSKLMFIDIAPGCQRLGGSAFAQSLSQIGDESTDVQSSDLLIRAFNAIQQLIRRNLILSGHDKTGDGGLITCLLEMAFAGNCGVDINLMDHHLGFKDLNALLFNEELGGVIEYEVCHEETVKGILRRAGLRGCYHVLGKTLREDRISIRHNNKVVLSEAMHTLRALWRETSFQLDAHPLQGTNPEAVLEERYNTLIGREPFYFTSFTPRPTTPDILGKVNKPKVAILREQGTNGDREMASAFISAGFEAWDVNMDDLAKGRVNLKSFKGIAFPGGFSFADVFGAAKGWAGVVKFNPRIAGEFESFMNRNDTFIFGVCNGCQLMALLGMVPYLGLSIEHQPRFLENDSRIFESRFSTVRIVKSNSIFLQGMEGSRLGVWVAHGEGKVSFPDPLVFQEVIKDSCAPIRYINGISEPTESYPFNPNGSPYGIAGLSSKDGRFLAMMPHPERLFLKWQWPYWPKQWDKIETSPWLQMFQNAYAWCNTN